MRQVVCGARKRDHFFQVLMTPAIHDLGLFLFDFLPLQLPGGNFGKCLRIEQRVPPLFQIRQESGARGRLLPIRDPTPLAGDDMYERVSHGTKAAAEIARELLIAQCRERLQNPAVLPTVVLVEQLNVIFSHGGGWKTPSSGNLITQFSLSTAVRKETR